MYKLFVRYLGIFVMALCLGFAACNGSEPAVEEQAEPTENVATEAVADSAAAVSEGDTAETVESEAETPPEGE